MTSISYYNILNELKNLEKIVCFCLQWKHGQYSWFPNELQED